jgi:DNA-binding NarL/FixJ family response regulator
MAKILVVDDHPVLRKNLARTLELEGHDVVVCDTGRQAVERAPAEQPELVLCDVMMSGMDGYAVLQALRSDPATATIPFIFLTARGEKFDLRQGMNAGADDYLTKPVDHEDLLAAIAARLQRKSAHDQTVDAKLSNVRMQPDFSSAVPLEQLGLTTREAEVLLWVAQGKSNGDVAAILGMAEKTVKAHLGSVFAKLGVESRTAALMRALEVLGSRRLVSSG